MSEMTPGEIPGVLSRMVSISRTTEVSERFWMMRPSCSVIEQKVQPPKQPRIIVTENLIMSQGGDPGIAIGGMRSARIWQVVDAIPSRASSAGSARRHPQVRVAMALPPAGGALPGIAFPECSTARGPRIGFAILFPTCSNPGRRMTVFSGQMRAPSSEASRSVGAQLGSSLPGLAF